MQTLVPVSGVSVQDTSCFIELIRAQPKFGDYPRHLKDGFIIKSFYTLHDKFKNVTDFLQADMNDISQV